MRVSHGLALSVCVFAVVATGQGTGVRASQRSTSPPPTGEAAFRALYKELVEINTTLSAGSCTEAAIAMKVHLAKAGYPDGDLHIVVPPDRPKDGNLIALLPGSDTSLKPVMLLAHVDVVEAKREDWVRDPFRLTEEGGYFYARGASDDKAMAAIFVDSMIRFKQEGYRPKRLGSSWRSPAEKRHRIRSTV
jgi:acetylornithine deacetylase/succinyl-diaminopimelate desuccinylase-like protein